jgi:hypothetical protein
LPARAHAAFDAVLCLKNTGSGTPKFRVGKPPAPAACKSTEIQIAHFDGTTFQFTGVNVQIVSGSGTTDGAVNGKGNLIVGYNEAGICEPGGQACNRTADCTFVPGVFCNVGGPKTGSHNLIVGTGNGYNSYGGLVVGVENTISGVFASVSGGQGNTASGLRASVSGGLGNTASGDEASVSGGRLNTASATGASVSGGDINTASAVTASVSGGSSNSASGSDASVSGGTGLSQPATNGWAAGSVEPANTVVGNFESP